jgi:hypothetical protein
MSEAIAFSVSLAVVEILVAALISIVEIDSATDMLTPELQVSNFLVMFMSRVDRQRFVSLRS